MKWTRVFSAVIALAGMTASADAGLFGSGGCKSCGCAEDCQPACCKPTIARPCHTNVYTYQRKCSDIKPPCCDTCGDPGAGCGPVTCCAPADACGNGCNADPSCCAPADACGNGCNADPSCCAPAACGNGCNADPSCCAPAACGNGCNADPSCCAPAACGNGCNADPSCCAPAACGDNGCCDAGNACGEGCDCCNDDACEIAKLIYTSMTACHGSTRRRALDKLGRKYDCCCHPEIMNAFVYGLNDTDERVRREAADEIGDQVRRNKCCCSPCVVSALTCALADCDRSVRREAEQALRNCGYEIVDGCCDGCTDAGCCSTGCGSNACGATPTAAPAEAQQPTPAAEAAPVAAPPADPQAFFPSRLHKQSSSKNGLAGLFGMAR